MKADGSKSHRVQMIRDESRERLVIKTMQVRR
jgi:hypothetical protein